MFILIFVDPRQINVTYSYFSYLGFDSYILNIKKIMTKTTYMINHILIKQMWLEENIILIKDVQKWVDEKLLKNPMKKKVLQNISEDYSSKIG
jgi:hypothetical protein